MSEFRGSKRSKSMGAIAALLLLGIGLLICLPVIMHEPKFHVDNVLSLYVANPKAVGISGIEDIKNENPLFGDGYFLIRFSITPEGAGKLLDAHPWEVSSTGPDEHLANADGAVTYHFTTPRGHQVYLALNADHTQGAINIPGL